MDSFYDYIIKDAPQNIFLQYSGYASQLEGQYKSVKESLDDIKYHLDKITEQWGESFKLFKKGYDSSGGETYTNIERTYKKVAEDLSKFRAEFYALIDECNKRCKVYSKMHENCTNLIADIGMGDLQEYLFTILGVAATAKKILSLENID